MNDLKKPLIRASLRSDTLNQTSFLNSFILGQAVKKKKSTTRTKVALSQEQLELNNLYSQSEAYILKNAENTVATPFEIICLERAENGNILFCSSNGNISRYDMKEGKIIDDIPLNIGIINKLILDENCERAIVVGITPILRVYRLPRFELDYELTGHTLCINKCVFSSTKEFLFTVSDDSTVHKWDLQNKKDMGVILKHVGMGKSLAVSPCGKYVFSGGEDCLIRVYDLNLSEEVLNLKSHVACIFSLDVNKTSTSLASGGADNIVIVWNILDFTPMHVFNEHLGVINSLKFTQELEFLVSASGDNTMKVWDLEKDRREVTLNSHTAPLRDILICNQNEYIISCSDDKSFKIWSFPEFMEDRTFKVLNNEFNSVLEANKSIISCGSDHKIRYWKRSTDEAGVIATTNGVGLKCCLSLDKAFIAAGDDYGYLYLFSKDYTPLKEFQAHKGPIRDMCFISTGELVTGGGDSKILIWNIETWESRTLMGHQQSIWCLAYSPKCPQYLASGSSDNTIRLWDVQSSYEIAILQLQEQVTSLYLLDDGNYLIAGSIVGTVSIWSIYEKIEESAFKLHTDMVTGIIVSDDNQSILSVSKDRSIHFISLQYRVPVTYITRKQPILCFALSEEKDEILTGESQMIYIQDNPSASFKTRILGPEENIQKFLTYMKNLINGIHVPHDPTMDKFLIVPYFFNTLHLYTCLGLREYLIASLIETAAITPSQGGYHPLYIALLKGFKGMRDDIIDALINIGSTNPFIFQILENVMLRMNQKAFPKLGSIYEAIYQPAARRTLPHFCTPEIQLPVVCISQHPRAIPEQFLDNQDYMNHGTGILFKESYVRLNYVMGSSDSILFLESLATCTNLDVMRSPLIQAMVEYKWEMARYPMMIQGCCFYVYLLILSVYIYTNTGTTTTSYYYFEGILFLVNTLLMLYEVFQMTVSGSFYFTYLWNYVDWLRSITLYAYIIIHVIDNDNDLSDSIFSVAIFLSFIRGISYFRLFKLTRYLINLLFQVGKDIQGFLILLIYSVLAFCFLFIVLNRGDNQSDPEFSTQLMGSYNLALGSFDTKDYNIVEFLCLTFALLINPIIMLNLLISIIGDTYDRVQSDSLSADMMELMDMIQEVENMLFFRRNNNTKHFFQECTEYEKQDQNAGWEGKLRALQSIIESIGEKNLENHKDVIKRIRAQDKILVSQSEKIEKVVKMLSDKDKTPDNPKEAAKKKGK